MGGARALDEARAILGVSADALEADVSVDPRDGNDRTSSLTIPDHTAHSTGLVLGCIDESDSERGLF